jgi:uridine kinase
MKNQFRFNFKHVDAAHRSLVHSWLRQPHVAEWFYGQGLENTFTHLDEFLEGSLQAQYWLAFDSNHPFAFLITSSVRKPDDPLTRWCLEDGDAITLDMLIGDLNYLGKGLSHILIQEFLVSQFPHVAEVFIDPEATNTRAVHVYEKVGFKILGEFIPSHSPHPHYEMRLSMKNLKNDFSLGKKFPLIIGISGISGAGKSTLMKKLEQTLHATVIYWDDYDDISQSPEDLVKWYESSKDYDDWVYDDLGKTLKKLKTGEKVRCPATKKELTPTKYILFDAPLGYAHKATGKYIDFLICLDTPLDIALARRLLRDYQDHPEPQKILEELDFYLTHSRPLYMLPECRQGDLLLDGSMSVEQQEKEVLIALEKFTIKRAPK